MKVFVFFIDASLLLGLIIVPIALYKRRLTWFGKKQLILKYLLTALISTAILTVILAWWNDFSTELLLRYHGYNFDSLNGEDRYAQVADESKLDVHHLEIRYFGIGWPLKAIMGFSFYSPYLLVVYLIGHIAGSRSQKSRF